MAAAWANAGANLAGKAPDPQPVGGPEVVELSGKTFLVAGKQVVGASNVTPPRTMTVYSPQGKNTGAAAVIFPGGGYQTLAIDLEATEACEWLTSQGITCVLLKYRVTDVELYPKSGHIQNRRWSWKTHRGPWGWFVCTRPRGTSTRTKSEYWGLRREDILWQR